MILSLVDEFQEFFTEDDQVARQNHTDSRSPGEAGTGVRDSRDIGIADAERAATILYRGARLIKWRCASRCNAVKPMRT